MNPPVIGKPDEVPARDTVRITPYRDGPLLVRGPVRLMTSDGTVLESRRSTVALCRCGKSKLRPFCDGTHKQTGFRAPAGDELEVTQTSASPAGSAAAPSE